MALLLLLSVPILFYGLGSYSVVNGDEAIYHRIALNMVETGNWGHLDFVGQHRVYDTFMNAPLQYWARASVITLLGDSYWSMRILSALAALLSTLAVYGLVAYLFNRRAALLAGIVQITTFQFVYLHGARTGELEPMICLAFAAAALLLGWAIDRGRSFAPHFICVALLMNLKLPLVIVPLLADLVFLATIEKGRARLLQWFRTGAMILPFGLAWHVTQFFVLGGDAVEILATMGSQGAGEMHRVNRQADYIRNLWFYARTIFVGGFPYSVVYPLAAAAALTGATDRRQRVGLRLLVIYPSLVMIFFVIVARHHPWYIMPIYPFASALVGVFLERLGRTVFGLWAALATAVPLAVLAWVHVGVAGFNPFAVRAIVARPEVGWRTPLGIPWGAGVLATVVALALALYCGRTVLRRNPLVVAGVLLATLVGIGAYRSLYPLTFLPHISEMEQLRDRLAADRAAGRTLRYPIPVREGGHLRARYYFADDFVVRGTRHREDISFMLYRKEEP